MSKKQPKKPKVQKQVEHEFQEVDDFESLGKKPKIVFKTEAQGRFWSLINEKEITFCVGPSGTGKSYLSVAKAVDLLFTKENGYREIIIIKPVVEADEKLGALPGDLEEKLSPYTDSTFYLFEKLIGKRKLERLVEKGFIKQKALAFLRGANVDNAVVIFEEAQNCTARQMKTLLTRIGYNAKFIINGDLDQSDRYKSGRDSGLYYAIEKLGDLNEVGVFEFSKEDIVRNPLIGKILEKLNGGI